MSSLPRLAAFAAALLGALARAAVFNVVDFGAVGSGRVYDTRAIAAAFSAATAAGGGVVLFPADHVFLTGCFNVSANTVVSVQGTILGSPNNTGYVLVDPLPWFGGWGLLPNNGQNATDPREWQPLVQGWYVNNVTFNGGGVIDGNGGAWWACAGNLAAPPCNSYPRPHGIRLVGSTGVHIHNLTIRNMPMWQTHLAYVTGAHLHDLTITAPVGRHNTDGIDPDCAQDVLIERVFVSTGDDMIAIKAGRDWNGRTFGRPSANITIRDSVFGSGHGLSIGSEMSGGVVNVSFSNLLVNGTGGSNLAGIRLKSERGRGGAIANISYTNITLIDISGQAIQMTLNYDSSVPPTNASGTPTMTGISLVDVTAIRPGTGWQIDGLPESPLRGVTFTRVNISGASKLFGACDYIEASACVNVVPACPPCVGGSGGSV